MTMGILIRSASLFQAAGMMTEDRILRSETEVVRVLLYPDRPVEVNQI